MKEDREKLKEGDRDGKGGSPVEVSSVPDSRDDCKRLINTVEVGLG